jgi:23S rRNA G2445 N2-methylase RlmL
MRGLVFCNKGIEDITCLEIKELIRSNAIPKEGFAEFEFDKKEQLCLLSYMAQSVKKILFVLDSFKFSSKKDLLKKCAKLSLKGWLDKDKTFRAEAKVIDSGIDQEEIKGDIGKEIIDSIKDYTQKVDLEDPDLTICAFIKKDIAYICIDFSGLDLSKRNYRIFTSPKSIKSTIAYAMVRLSGYKEGDIFVDPFCISGIIPIETSLFQNRLPVRFFEKDDLLFTRFMEFDFEKVDKKATKDKGNIFAFDSMFKNIDAAKKNAKIASLNKTINFSRLEINWLDTKFDRESVDCIVTCPPNITRYSNRNEIIKLYKELFHQAEFILKKSGKIVLCTRSPEEIKEEAEEKSFKLEEEREVWQGKEKLCLLKFRK